MSDNNAAETLRDIKLLKLSLRKAEFDSVAGNTSFSRTETDSCSLILSSAKPSERYPEKDYLIEILNPGETKADFLETYEFLNQLNISYLHVFTYSQRDNTPAIEMPDPVPLDQRQERSRMLHILSDKKRRAFYQDNCGKSASVLFENDVEDGMMHGFTSNYVRVAANYDPLLINEIKKVKLTDINSKGLMMAEDYEGVLIQ